MIIEKKFQLIKFATFQPQKDPKKMDENIKLKVSIRSSNYILHKKLKMKYYYKIFIHFFTMDVQNYKSQSKYNKKVYNRSMPRGISWHPISCNNHYSSSI